MPKIFHMLQFQVAPSHVTPSTWSPACSRSNVASSTILDSTSAFTLLWEAKTPRICIQLPETKIQTNEYKSSRVIKYIWQVISPARTANFKQNVCSGCNFASCTCKWLEHYHQAMVSKFFAGLLILELAQVDEAINAACVRDTVKKTFWALNVCNYILRERKLCHFSTLLLLILQAI